MTTEYKYFSKHFFRNVFISLLVFFAFCLFIYKNETALQASVAQYFIEELPDDYLEISGWYVEDGKPKSAIKILKKACKNDPENRGAYLAEIADIYIDKIGNREAGIEALEEACKTNPDDSISSKLSVVYAEAGYENFISDNYEGTIQCFENCIRLEADSADAVYSVLGVCYKRLGRYEAAVEALMKALEINPDYANSYYLLGSVYDELERYDEAILAYRKAVEINPKDDVAYHSLGYVYGKLGRHKQEIEAYKKAIELVPDEAVTHYNLGKTYIEIGNKDSALQQYEILKTLDEKSANELLELINQ
jgi:tetratricopeptide (TPR) repeat protein